MPDNREYVEVKCLEMVQPIGNMYVGIMDHLDLEHISYVDIRRLKSKNEQREVEIYSGIQRVLSDKREKEIGKYVNMVDATFPTSIILHIDPDNASYDKESLTLKIRNQDTVAKVLDGQHRIAGLSHFEGRHFQLNVTIFVGMELEDQAIVFATINHTQTKVNKSLVADLFDFATHRSPQKTAHSIARALNEKEGSPFKDKIKVLGTADDKEKETITQATFVESVLKYITKDKAHDRDLYRRGKKLEVYDGQELRNRFLRTLFVQEDDGSIAKILWNYFKAVEARWPLAWERVTPELVLNRSTGFIALMRFLKDAYLSISGESIGRVPEQSEFAAILERVSISDTDINRTNYLPGSGGQAQLYKDLLIQSKLSTGSNGS
jgi:DGQHR domain-containing protein